MGGIAGVVQGRTSSPGHGNKSEGGSGVNHKVRGLGKKEKFCGRGTKKRNKVQSILSGNPIHQKKRKKKKHQRKERGELGGRKGGVGAQGGGRVEKRGDAK